MFPVIKGPAWPSVGEIHGGFASMYPNWTPPSFFFEASALKSAGTATTLCSLMEYATTFVHQLEHVPSFREQCAAPYPPRVSVLCAALTHALTLGAHAICRVNGPADEDPQLRFIIRQMNRSELRCRVDHNVGLPTDSTFPSDNCSILQRSAKLVVLQII